MQIIDGGVFAKSNITWHMAHGSVVLRTLCGATVVSTGKQKNLRAYRIVQCNLQVWVATRAAYTVGGAAEGEPFSTDPTTQPTTRSGLS